ncbi:MAG: FMN-binding glutamate synthase family protein, partial [Marinospirillum sp.]|nr:FMN-binding glutamate synthase family protein [Marinospirillum sp.]
PSGVATQDPRRGNKLDVPLKSERVYNFHRKTLDALQNLLEASGLNHPSELGPENIIRRVSKTEVHSYLDLFPFLEPGALLEGQTGLAIFDRYWAEADPYSFGAPTSILKLRETKLR